MGVLEDAISRDDMHCDGLLLSSSGYMPSSQIYGTGALVSWVHRVDGKEGACLWCFGCRTMTAVDGRRHLCLSLAEVDGGGNPSTQIYCRESQCRYRHFRDTGPMAPTSGGSSSTIASPSSLQSSLKYYANTSSFDIGLDSKLQRSVCSVRQARQRSRRVTVLGGSPTSVWTKPYIGGDT